MIFKEVHRHPWAWPMGVGIIVLWCCLIYEISQNQGLTDRVAAVERRLNRAEQAMLTLHSRQNEPKPEIPPDMTSEVSSAHNRLDRLADAIDAMCQWIPGRARCPELVAESRER